MYSHASDGSKLSLFSGRGKRSHKRYAWNEKKRAGMSFLIVIAFFTVFALIILTEVLMIDDKNRTQTFGGGGNGVRHSSYSRFGESVPDYEDIKDEYSIEDAVFSRNRFKETKTNNNNNRGKYCRKCRPILWEECIQFLCSTTHVSFFLRIYVSQPTITNIQALMESQRQSHGDQF